MANVAQLTPSGTRLTGVNMRENTRKVHKLETFPAYDSSIFRECFASLLQPPHQLSSSGAESGGRDLEQRDRQFVLAARQHPKPRQDKRNQRLTRREVDQQAGRTSPVTDATLISKTVHLFSLMTNFLSEGTTGDFHPFLTHY